MSSQPKTTLLASTLLFPSFTMQETGLEGFGVETVAGSNAPFEFGELSGGFGIQNRVVIGGEEPILGGTARARFRVQDGGLFWEDVVLSPGALYLVARKSFGTVFDFGLGPYQSEVQLLGRDNGTTHVRVFVPVTLNPVGLANTDQDTDGALKYVFRAGAGAGVDAMFGLGSTVLIGARAQGDYRYTYRAGGESLTHNRGDVEWLFDVGVGGKTSTKTSVMATFFFQDWRQWEYDAATDGQTRGNQVIGGRLTFRYYGGDMNPVVPEVPMPETPVTPSGT